MNYDEMIKRFGSGRSFRKVGSGEFAEGRRYYLAEMIKQKYKFNAIERSENDSFVMVSKEEKEICTIRDIDFLDTFLDMCKSGRL